MEWFLCPIWPDIKVSNFNSGFFKGWITVNRMCSSKKYPYPPPPPLPRKGFDFPGGKVVSLPKLVFSGRGGWPKGHISRGSITEKFEAPRGSHLNSEAETLTSFSNVALQKSEPEMAWSRNPSATHHFVPGGYYPLMFLRSTSKGWLSSSKDDSVLPRCRWSCKCIFTVLRNRTFHQLYFHFFVFDLPDDWSMEGAMFSSLSKQTPWGKNS